ncbi:hypothetical protein B484DRAFT_392729 [Ochromonadaceae sp. CCMP2298]|nr:hypothetical protein B484DRAFT_392729 [Ochromonadaceae sp. CCMP2298]
MSDYQIAFNPHELLSKLRAKSSSSASSSLLASNAPTPTSSQRAASGQEARASRQENLNARLEMEREIKRLQTEMVALRSENVQLRTDKEDVEQQLVEYRVKSEETITKLRGKIASVAIHSGVGAADRGSGAGKLYPPSPNLFNSSVMSASMSSSVGRTFPGSGRSPDKPFTAADLGGKRPPPPPSAEDMYRQISASGGSFRDPTFSELMRRSTADHQEYTQTLRRQGANKPGPTPPGSMPMAPSPAGPMVGPGGHERARHKSAPNMPNMQFSSESKSYGHPEDPYYHAPHFQPPHLHGQHVQYHNPSIMHSQPAPTPHHIHHGTYSPPAIDFTAAAAPAPTGKHESLEEDVVSDSYSSDGDDIPVLEIDLTS